MGEFPSGQRGQTVNLLRFASMVRIRPPPPQKDQSFWIGLFVHTGSRMMDSKGRSKQTVRWTVCPAVARPQPGESVLPHHKPIRKGLVFFVRLGNRRGMEQAKPSYRSTVIMLYCFINRISSRLTFSFCSSSSSWFRRFLEKSILMATGIMGLLDRPVNRPHFTSVLV